MKKLLYIGGAIAVALLIYYAGGQTAMRWVAERQYLVALECELRLAQLCSNVLNHPTLTAEEKVARLTVFNRAHLESLQTTIDFMRPLYSKRHTWLGSYSTNALRGSKPEKHLGAP